MFYEYTCRRYSCFRYGETERHLKVRPDEHIRISPLAFKKTKPSEESSIRDYFLQCDNDPSFGEFTILAHGNKKYFIGYEMSLVSFYCDSCSFYNLSRC